MRIVLLTAFLCFCTASLIFAQQSDAGVDAASGDAGVESSDEGDEEELLPEAEDQKLEPVFPQENPAIIHLEAEDAVSTNFAKEPTLNYAASRFRTLQLNRYTGLYGGAAFFAEYVFYVEQPGTYELWYGGTPPGPQEDLFPSYASPFSYRIDNGTPNPAYRENVVVVDGYTPSYYWVNVGPVELDAGIHTIRFEINEKRRFDGKYFFYLDSLFLIDRENAFQEDLPLPDLFPVDLDNTLLDEPFKSINDYQYLISIEPNNVWNYIELSLIYSMLGDYLNALKNLNRAALIDPENTYVALLTAKNRIWKGDAEEGLRAYERLLELDQSQRDIWAEAGKVAAWISKYDDSINFFNNGLSRFPGDLNLTVNLGLTYLWNSQEEKAQEQFAEAESIAKISPELIEELGNIYLVNGYPQYALDLYKNSIRDFPEVLSLYLNLEAAYAEVGRNEDAKDVHLQIIERFVESDRLSSYLETFSIKQGLKEEVISAYQRELEEQPDNLDLREVLVQTYFWNGLRTRAIEEYLNILSNHAYRSFIEFDTRSSEFLELIDTLYLYAGFFENLPQDLPEMKSAINDRLSAYRNAIKAHEKFLADVEEAEEKGESPPEREVDTSEALATTQFELADLVATLQAFVDSADTMTESAQPFLDSIDGHVDKENTDKEAFADLVSSLKWKWDRTAFVSELIHVSENGVVLADHVLARLFQIERRLEQAGERLTPLVQTGRAAVPSLFAFAELGLWQNQTLDSDELPVGAIAAISEYAPFVGGLLNLETELQREAQQLSGFFAEEVTEDQAEILMSELDRLRSLSSEKFREAQSALGVLHGILRNRLTRFMFQLQQDTALIRFELGDYYLLEDRYAEAIEQFQHVLAVDPWNTSANYKLGVVNQRAGNWSRAMARYRQVYYADPRFENVAANYNYLARQNADAFSFNAHLLADTSRIIYHGDASVMNNLNGAIALETRYNMDNVRLYQPSDPEVPSTYQIHEITGLLPLKLNALHLTIKPIIGAAFTTQLIEGTFPGVDDSKSAANVLNTIELEPVWGADVLLDLYPLFISSTYRYGRVQETFTPYRGRFIYHAGDANISLSLKFLGIPLLENSSIRTYGKIEGRQRKRIDESEVIDDYSFNFIISAAQELNFVLHVLDSPWTNLSIVGLVVFEHAQNPNVTVEYAPDPTKNVTAYYAPNGVLSAKGGLTGATWIGLGNDFVLGLSLRIDGGLYATELLGGSALPTQITAEAEGRVEITRGNGTYYLSALYNGTFNNSSVSYWSGRMRIGYTAKLPRLLAQ